jgi:hypothetical protein
LRDKIQGSEEDVVSIAQLQQLPPLPVDMRWPCHNPDRPCVQVGGRVAAGMDAIVGCSKLLQVVGWPANTLPNKYGVSPLNPASVHVDHAALWVQHNAHSRPKTMVLHGFHPDTPSILQAVQTRAVVVKQQHTYAAAAAAAACGALAGK